MIRVQQWRFGGTTSNSCTTRPKCLVFISSLFYSRPTIKIAECLFERRQCQCFSMLHRSEDCHKFRSCKDTGDFGVHDDICTCDWRPGLVHRPGQVAVPEFRAPSHRGPRIPLAGWFGSLPASRSPSTRVNGRVVNSPRKQSTTDQRKSPQRPSAKSGSSCFNGDLRVGGKWKFRHRTEAKSHMEDYREKFALRLVGVDGGPVVDSSEFGKNLPDPYANKSDDYRFVTW